MPPTAAPVTSDIDRLLDSLPLRDRIAQLIVPWIPGTYAALDDPGFARARMWVDSLHVGGIIVSVGSPLDIAAKLNALQAAAPLPLLITSDLESGTAIRLDGGTPFPPNMGVGAGGRELDAYQIGRVTALEGRAVGIHIAFAPAADVNNNPGNPIINTRSFGEDPHAVAPLVAAAVRGIQEHDMLSTVKHFPGHGDTETDSHLALPVITADWARFDSLELVPFRAAIDAGVDVVMSAHIAMPGIDDGELRPATVAPSILTGVLRDSLGFRGLTVTDALNMAGVVAKYGGGEATVLAFLAGADMLLMPVDPAVAIDAMEQAVMDGRISGERLDASVRRVLEIKRRLGLFTNRSVQLDSVMATVGREDFKELARDIAARSIVLAKDDGTADSLRAAPRKIGIVMYGEGASDDVGSSFAAELRSRGHDVSSFRLRNTSGVASYDSARALVERSPVVIFAVAVRAVAWKGSIGLPAELNALIDSTAASRPTLLASFGSPYIVMGTPNVGSYLVGWSANPVSERAAARALSGAAITGRLPISIPPSLPLGTGLKREVVEPGPIPAALFEPATRFLDSAIGDHAAPGAVLAVSVRGHRSYHGAGRFGLDDATRPDSTTVYDLASLTKVVGLTTAVMLAARENRLELDAPIARYVPAFAGEGKERVTVRHLLTHTSGLPAWRPLHLESVDRTGAFALADTTPLDTVPGARYVYSDLGALLLTQAVESVYGTRLDSLLARRVFEPLRMSSTRFLPPSDWLSRIPPTENDPWRGRTLRGEVHDENASRLDGVSGHAGLFSSASDLLTFGEWMLGSTDAAGLGRPTAAFTVAQGIPEGSSRALGWDTPSAGSSAGVLLSDRSFGHTGFTGTSIWMDPARDLVVVLLSNRVHPTRENAGWGAVRRGAADLVAGAVDAFCLQHRELHASAR